MELTVHFNQKHGQARPGFRSRTYRSWETMKRRCSVPHDPAYPEYGGRGISFDPEWSTFLRFLEDMGERPEGKTLDRVDSNLGYCKENCRWATPSEQSRNKRNNTKITVFGETMTVVEASERFGKPYRLIHERIFRGGWGHERAVTEPVKPLPKQKA